MHSEIVRCLILYAMKYRKDFMKYSEEFYIAALKLQRRLGYTVENTVSVNYYLTKQFTDEMINFLVGV